MFVWVKTRTQNFHVSSVARTQLIFHVAWSESLYSTAPGALLLSLLYTHLIQLQKTKMNTFLPYVSLIPKISQYFISLCVERTLDILPSPAAVVCKDRRELSMRLSSFSSLHIFDTALENHL